MPRGEFHIFSCRSGRQYAEKVTEQLKSIIKERGDIVVKKKASGKKLTLYEKREKKFAQQADEVGHDL